MRGREPAELVVPRAPLPRWHTQQHRPQPVSQAIHGSTSSVRHEGRVTPPTTRGQLGHESEHLQLPEGRVDAQSLLRGRVNQAICQVLQLGRELANIEQRRPFLQCSPGLRPGLHHRTHQLSERPRRLLLQVNHLGGLAGQALFDLRGKHCRGGLPSAATHGLLVCTRRTTGEAEALFRPRHPIRALATRLLRAGAAIAHDAARQAGHHGPAVPTESLVARRLLAHGVTAFLPTVITSSKQAYLTILPQLVPTAGSANGAAVLGVHLEGPFLSPSKPGCHPPSNIVPPDGRPEALRRACGEHISHVRLVTLAPELEGAKMLVDELLARGVVVSAVSADARSLRGAHTDT